MDCSPPGSSVHGISQAGILESIAISVCECCLVMNCLFEVVVLIGVCSSWLRFLFFPLPEPISSWNMDIVEDTVKVVRCWMVGQRVSGSWKNSCWPWSPWWLGYLRSGLACGSLCLVFRRQVYFDAASQLGWLREAEALPGDWGWWHTPRPGMAQGLRVIFCLSFSLWQSRCLLSEWSRNCPHWSGADKVDGVCRWRTQKQREWKGVGWRRKLGFLMQFIFLILYRNLRIFRLDLERREVSQMRYTPSFRCR